MSAQRPKMRVKLTVTLDVNIDAWMADFDVLSEGTIPWDVKEYIEHNVLRLMNVVDDGLVEVASVTQKASR